jgi:hypothetical protein
MINKSKIIKIQGSTVDILKYDRNSLNSPPLQTNTKAIISRASRSNTNMVMLESQKQAILLPTVDVSGGDYLKQSSTYYVISGLVEEHYKDKVISKVVNLLKCNNTFKLKSNTISADDKGNLIKNFVEVISDLPCYIEEVSADLKRLDAGLHADTEYYLYAFNIPLLETDKIIISVNSVEQSYKIMAKDYLTFPNMVIIQICRNVGE